MDIIDKKPYKIGTPEELEQSFHEYMKWCRDEHRYAMVHGFAVWLGVSSSVLASRFREEIYADVHQKVKDSLVDHNFNLQGGNPALQMTIIKHAEPEFREKTEIDIHNNETNITANVVLTGEELKALGKMATEYLLTGRLKQVTE